MQQKDTSTSHKWVLFGSWSCDQQNEVQKKSKRLLIASGVSQESLLKIILLKVSANGLGSGTENTSARFWVKLDQCGEHSIS